MVLSKKTHIHATLFQSIVFNSLCISASKLWNMGNYERLNHKELNFEKYPDWYDQKKRLKQEFWYKNLPSQTAQEVLKDLNSAWKSFYELKKGNKSKNPRPPRFKYSGIGFKYLDKAISRDRSSIRLSIPAQLKKYIKDKYGFTDDYIYIEIKCFREIQNIKQIQIIPLTNNLFEVIAIYETKDIKKLIDNGKYLSIDLGLNNLCSCYSNKGEGFIISGSDYLNAQYYFNKKIAYYQHISDSDAIAKEIKYPKKSKRVLSLYKQKRDKINDIIHKTTRTVANYCVQNNINTVVIGDITNIRENKNFGNKVNQIFHALPFKELYNKLEYKLALEGITLIKQKENYSSQCSPLSFGVSKKYAQKIKRKHRGLYIDERIVYNADMVGAYNILRLYGQSSGKRIKSPILGLSNPSKVPAAPLTVAVVGHGQPFKVVTSK